MIAARSLYLWENGMAFQMPARGEVPIDGGKDPGANTWAIRRCVSIVLQAIVLLDFSVVSGKTEGRRGGVEVHGRSGTTAP
jgi:hypothetical protein